MHLQSLEYEGTTMRLGKYLLFQRVLFFVFLPPKLSATYSSSLWDRNRSSKVTLTSPLGLHADISPPLHRAGGPPIKVSSKPRVPRPIYDTFKSRLCCKQVTKSYTSLLPATFTSPSSVVYNTSTILSYHCPVIAAVQKSHSHCLVYLLFGAFSVHSSRSCLWYK